MPLTFPIIDPIAFSIGPFAIRWYALAYVAGLLGGWFYAKRLAARADLWGPLQPQPQADRHRRPRSSGWRSASSSAAGSATCCSTISAPTLADPLEILAVWHGGMSFHGGFLGAALAIVLFARCARAQPARHARHGGGGDADRPVLRPHRQFHQRRALGPRRARLSLCGGVSPCGPAAAPSEPALRGLRRGARALRRAGHRRAAVRLPPARPRSAASSSSAMRSPASSASSSASRTSSSASCSAPRCRRSERRHHHGHAAVAPDGAPRGCA